MSTVTQQEAGTRAGAAPRDRMVVVAALVAIVVGLGSVLGGLGGMIYT